MSDFRVMSAAGPTVPGASTYAVAPPAAQGAVVAALAGTPSPELVRRLGHLRATLARYVCARRAAGAPSARVLADVQALVRATAVAEAWVDHDHALLAEVAGWTMAAYDEAPLH